MKASRERRKFVNAMRQMGDVPWPPRRFRVAPTFASVPTTLMCPRKVTDVLVRPSGLLGRLKKKQTAPVVCGAPVELVPHKGLRCRACKQRRRLSHRLVQAETQRLVDAHARASRWRPRKLFKRRAT